MKKFASFLLHLFRHPAANLFRA